MNQITGHRPKVFISYRRKPSAMLATLIATHLQENGIDAYVDTRESGGGPFPDRLLHAIQDSDVFVSLLADDTLESEWVLREIEHAHNLNKPMIPVFQESFERPQPAPNEHITALLRYDGVHILDVKNLYVDQAMDTLVRMIWQSTGSSPFASRRMLWLAGGVALLVVLIAVGLFLSPMFRGKVDTTTPTLLANPPTGTDTPTVDAIYELQTLEAGMTATAVAPVIAQTRAYAQTRIAAYQTNVAATATATLITPTPTMQPSATLTATEGPEQPPLVMATFVLATQAAVDFEVLQLVGTLDAGGSLSQLEIQNYQDIYQIAAENQIIANDAGAAPDINLRISDVSVNPRNPAPGQPFELSVIIENTGTDGSGPFDVQWFASEILGATFSQTVDNVPAGASTTINFSYSYGWWGEYPSTLWVDPSNTVSESDETDNIVEQIITNTDEPIVVDFDTLPDTTEVIQTPLILFGDEFLGSNLTFDAEANGESQCSTTPVGIMEINGDNVLTPNLPDTSQACAQLPLGIDLVQYYAGGAEIVIMPTADGEVTVEFSRAEPSAASDIQTLTAHAGEPLTLTSNGEVSTITISSPGQSVNLSRLTLYKPADDSAG